MENPEKKPDWLTTGITYFLPKSGDSKETRNYRPERTYYVVKHRREHKNEKYNLKKEYLRKLRMLMVTDLSAKNNI
jgi:hypothetical protein